MLRQRFFEFIDSNCCRECSYIECILVALKERMFMGNGIKITSSFFLSAQSGPLSYGPPTLSSFIFLFIFEPVRRDDDEINFIRSNFLACQVLIEFCLGQQVWMLQSNAVCR